MTTTRSRRLVIDASIARAAGSQESVNLDAQRCRDFLQSVLTICHKVVMTARIQEEWNKHQSNFARTWRRAMVARKKLIALPVNENQSWREAVEAHSGSEKDRKAMLKDCHLLEAAMATDRIITTLDEAARQLFTDVAANTPEISAIAWVNPTLLPDMQQWLSNGAPAEPGLQPGKLRDRQR
jgi:hypothetical protein